MYTRDDWCNLPFFFLVDVSINAIQIGATFGVFSAISRFVNHLPVSSCFFQKKKYNFLYFLRVNVLLICNNNNMIGVGGSSNTCGNYI